MTPTLPVEQADRDAAADLQDEQAAWLGMDFVASVHSEFLRDGSHDQDPGVQAFARHRIAHTPTPVTEGVRERARELLDAEMPAFGYPTGAPAPVVIPRTAALRVIEHALQSSGLEEAIEALQEIAAMGKGRHRQQLNWGDAQDAIDTAANALANLRGVKP